MQTVQSWSKCNRKTKIIYNLINSYLAIPTHDLKGLFRGFAKYITRHHKYLQFSYWKSLEDMCERADAIVCTTEEQKDNMLKFCTNVHIILDFHSDSVQNIKSDYTNKDVFNIVWEGLPHSIQTLSEVKEVLKCLKKKYKIAFHMVTDIQYYNYFGKYWKRNTKDTIRKLLDIEDIYLYEWNEQTFSIIGTACDMAIIPIPLNKPLYAGKPENKLLLFWKMGVPVVVSATPAYETGNAKMQFADVMSNSRRLEEYFRKIYHR